MPTLGIELKVFGSSFFAFGVFKVICDIILLAFGTYLFQIVKIRACEKPL
jgi:hypothetical protein